MTFPSRAGLALALAVVVAATASACGGGSSTSPGGDERDASFADSTGGGDSASGGDTGLDSTGSKDTGNGVDGTSGPDAGVDATSMDAGTEAGLDSSGGVDAPVETGPTCPTPGLDIEPSTLQTITVPAGTTSPTVTFTATFDCKPVNAGWSVDKGYVGTVPSIDTPTGLFTPSGSAGGLVTITSGVNGTTVQRQVLVKIVATQNGPTSGESGQVPTTTGQLTSGGGVGGVGGEGLGSAVPSFPTAVMPAAMGLSFLYPYDKTVWPRGLLAPLLMWTWTPGDADAIQIGLQTSSSSYTYSGTFGRPAILAQTGGKFIRMPIPQDVWAAATNSAGGTDTLTVSLIVAKGGVAYGPITETWTIAPGLLDGIIYYQSYGTQLVQNYSGAVGGNGQFGGAVLSIHVGDTAPKLVAGTTAPTSGCRVCHSVAAGGSGLVVQHGDNYGASSDYTLTPTTSTEHALTNGAQFPAVYPDGSQMLTPAGQLYPLPADATAIPTSGLTTVVTNLGTPMFSPDGTRIAFNPLSGAGVTSNTTLYTMTYSPATQTFAGLTLIAQETGATRLGWPAFFPDSKSVVYHHQTVASSCDGTNATVTRSGTRSQIYWTNLTGPTAATPLDQLNGKGYLPKLATASTLACSDVCGTPSSPTIGTINADHSDDVDVNYEPTVAPVAAGGYAWVVFTSRRMYGSEATIGSFCSDPRGEDLINNITPKKLWVAAIDLNQAPGTDSSHPAFYLPAQELLAGNSRGFWVLDPCQANGTSCSTGDQCCNGYCEPGDAGALTCSSLPTVGTCSTVSNKCTTVADCCDQTNVCINGFCAVPAPL